MMSEYLQQFSLDGRIAMVTGSAQGIGAEIAVALGEAGATVVISDRDAVMGAKQVAAAVVFLASSACNFMTATETVVDGGICGCQ